ncbi:MAG TPA: PAS domain-containing protein, partial [Pyrinomonadaceae bacterium]|nr:PAS domain-containing protein [Pyrinomonadaceae bacterium]
DTALFDMLDRKHRIYRQRSSQRVGIPIASGLVDGAVHRALQREKLKSNATALPGRAFADLETPDVARYGAVTEHMPPPNALHLRLLGRWGPPSAVVNADYDIVHLSENASRFLQFPEGEPTRNILRLAQPALRVGLRAALLAAEERGELVEVLGRAGENASEPEMLNLRVAPAGELAPGHFLILFGVDEPRGAQIVQAVAPLDIQAQAVVQQLEQQLARASSRLRETVEKYEVSSEELKSGNEELQAMNEELRSAGEELETGREEVQSVNEELTTLNAEFKERVEDLSRANSDLQNLMSATQIATVFLDRKLQITRYTPSAAPLFNLIAGDVGRPLSDLKQRLDYPELIADAEQVLRKLIPVEREMRADNRWLLARVLPYRTVEDYIAGVVLTFIDITDRKSFEVSLKASEEQFRRAIEDAPIPVIMQAEDGQVLQISKAWTELTGFRPEDVPTFEAWLNHAYGPGANVVREHMQRLFRGEVSALNAEFDIKTRDGTARHWVFSASAPGKLRDGRRFIVGMASDITERRLAEEQLRASLERLKLPP